MKSYNCGMSEEKNPRFMGCWNCGVVQLWSPGNSEVLEFQDGGIKELWNPTSVGMLQLWEQQDPGVLELWKIGMGMSENCGIQEFLDPWDWVIPDLRSPGVTGSEICGIQGFSGILELQNPHTYVLVKLATNWGGTSLAAAIPP